MRKLLTHLRRWIVPYAVTVAACAYTGYRAYETTFWDGAVVNLLATILGIIIGVPVALHVERQRQERDLRMSIEAARQSARAVADLLQRELSHVAGQMSVRSLDENSISMEPLRTSTWDAMRESGRLAQIADADLIDKVSTAYHHIGVLRAIEKSTVGAIFGVNVTFPDGENASTRLFRHSRQVHGAVNQSILLAHTALTSFAREE